MERLDEDLLGRLGVLAMGRVEVTDEGLGARKALEGIDNVANLR